MLLLVLVSYTNLFPGLYESIDLKFPFPFPFPFYIITIITTYRNRLKLVCV